MIPDLSFAVRQGKLGRGRKRSHLDDALLQPSVNNMTARLAPEGPVKELGNVLPRLLDFMASVPPEEHIHFSKMDLADRYWQVIVKPEAQCNFAYVMPSVARGIGRLLVGREGQIAKEKVAAGTAACLGLG
jgi:hypothetical protein